MAWITKTTRTYLWDAGARSIASLPGNGVFTFTVGQSVGIVCGLNESDLTVDYREINHAFWIEGNRYCIIESGEFKTELALFTPGAVFRIERFEDEVQYLIDDVWVFTSIVPSTGTVFLDASLLAYNDSIIDITCIEEQYCSPQALLLGRIRTAGIIEGEDQFGSFLLGGAVTSGSDEDLNEGTALLRQLIVSGGTDDFSYGRVLFPSPIVTTNDLLLPDINVGAVQFNPLYVRGTSEPADANLLLGQVFAHGSDMEEYGGALLSLPRTYGTTQLEGSFSAFWGQFSLSITCVPDLAIPLFYQSTSYGCTASCLHRVSYEGTSTVLALHEVLYGGTAQALSSTGWQSFIRSTAQAAQEAIYGTFGLAPTLATHAALWSSTSLAPSFSAHQASWESAGLSTQLTLHDALWSSRILTSTETLHTSDWASIGLSAQFTLHAAEWSSSGGVTQQMALHESLWSSRILTPSFALHDSTFASIGTSNVFAAHTSEWSTAGGSTQQISLHDALWSSRILTPSLNIHDSLWASSGGITQQMTLHHSSWNSAGGTSQVINVHDALWSSRILSSSISAHDALWSSPGIQVTLAVHQSRWSSIGAQSVEWTLHQATWASPGTSSFVFSAHDTSWSVKTTLLNTHEQRWKSVIETSMIHHSAYETVDNTSAFQIHLLLWRSNQTAPVITTGLIYARI